MIEPTRIYGATGAPGAAGRGAPTVVEALAVSLTTNARRYKLGGHSGWSAMFRNGGASGATSVLRVEYSNLPDPNPATDAHWVA
jgi:hypothetical protein